jgi:hypothetical protein
VGGEMPPEAVIQGKRSCNYCCKMNFMNSKGKDFCVVCYQSLAPVVF